MDSNGREGQSSDTRAMDNTSDRKRKRDENFYCEVCDISLSRKEHLERHNKSKAHKKKLETSSIGVKDSEAKKRRPNQKCKVCGIDVVNLHAHMKTNEHKDKCTEAFKDNVELINTCYKSRVASYRIRCHNKHLVPKEFMNDVKDCAMYLIAEKRDELNSSLKINFELFGEFLKVVNDDSVIEIKSFNTKNRVIEKRFDEDLDAVYEIFTEDVAVQADEFQERDSGWAMQEILYLEVNINEFSTMKSKSNQEKIVASTSTQSVTSQEESSSEKRSSFIPLPEWIQRKTGACINVQNQDDKCFIWAILSALFPPADKSKNVVRTSTYRDYLNKLKFDGVSFPISPKGIRKFEKLNEVSVNVFEVCDADKSISGPIYLTKQRREKHVNLLYIEGDNGLSHYCWIKDLSSLIRSQQTGYKGRMYYCDGCLQGFSKEKLLNKHMTRDCGGIKINPIPEGETLQFSNFTNKIRAPVVVYADFESILRPVATCEPTQDVSYTQQIQVHEPHSFGYFIKCGYDDSLSEYVSYRGTNCAQEFMTSLKNKLKPFAKRMYKKMPMALLNSAQFRNYKEAKICFICEKVIKDEKVKVRDHCHITGLYRGAAHKECNLNFKMKKVIPIVFHNLSNYDSHFIIKTLKDFDDLTVIPKNKENFISFTITLKGLGVKLRFIDSYRFMASSLEKLALNLSPDKFVNVKTQSLKNKIPEKAIPLLMRKGVFPYDYIEDWTNLEENALPPKDKFYNSLTKRSISNKEYKHAQNVWRTLNIKTIGQFSDIYLQTDVLLLTDIFENFRNICIETYQLDPAHYYTAPGLAWDAMLKSTRIELELLSDHSMTTFIQRGMRGGLSVCSGKYSKANNKYLKAPAGTSKSTNNEDKLLSYNPSDESRYIVYLDANNLYGWAMSKNLPLKNFKWLTESQVKNFDVTKYDDNSDKGYFLEVDIDYPHDLHEEHNDFPFCAESRVSDYPGSKQPKLIASLHNKTKYVIHYVNLKQALGKGLKLKKIHRVLEFTQSPWLKTYIDLNTNKRTKASNDFEKDFYKLMNNAVFGKTMENVDKRIDIKVVNKWESEKRRLGARALISRPNFHSMTKINEDLTIIQMNRTSVTYNKPIYVGFAVLELSKTLMYEFHYDYMLQKFKKDLTLLYTDTDSFIYEIRVEDFYDKIRKDLSNWFDTSNYSQEKLKE